MAKLKRLVLDVLKPRDPNVVEFAKAISALGPDLRVSLQVEEMDDKTETVRLEVAGDNLDLVALQGVIDGLGASLHSIDEVETCGEAVSEQE